MQGLGPMVRERPGQAAGRAASVGATPYANASGYHAPAALIAAAVPLAGAALLLVTQIFYGM